MKTTKQNTTKKQLITLPLYFVQVASSVTAIIATSLVYIVGMSSGLILTNIGELKVISDASDVYRDGGMAVNDMITSLLDSTLSLAGWSALITVLAALALWFMSKREACDNRALVRALAIAITVMFFAHFNQNILFRLYAV